jgi:hypothetical protein
MKSKASGIKYVMYQNGVVYTKSPKVYHSTITNERIADYLLIENKVSRAKIDEIIESDEELVLRMLDEESLPLLQELEPDKFAVRCPSCSSKIFIAADQLEDATKCRRPNKN